MLGVAKEEVFPFIDGLPGISKFFGSWVIYGKKAATPRPSRGSRHRRMRDPAKAMLNVPFVLEVSEVLIAREKKPG